MPGCASPQTYDTKARDRLARELTINPQHARPEPSPEHPDPRSQADLLRGLSVRQRINGDQHFKP